MRFFTSLRKALAARPRVRDEVLYEPGGIIYFGGNMRREFNHLCVPPTELLLLLLLFRRDFWSSDRGFSLLRPRREQTLQGPSLPTHLLLCRSRPASASATGPRRSGDLPRRPLRLSVRTCQGYNSLARSWGSTSRHDHRPAPACGPFSQPHLGEA